ncbi:9075_t:CDS:2, partial [Gigaspora rosea]
QKKNHRNSFHKFEEGVKNWLKKQRNYAQMRLVVAVIELALIKALEGFDLKRFNLKEIKTMMTPNEAAAGQKILNQINESDIDDELSKIVNFNNQLKSDLNDVKKISSSIIDDQREMISMLLQKSKLENDKKWEFTRRQIMKLFKLPIRENLKTSEEFKNINMPNEPSFEGAEDYLLSLENFFIFINAYIKAKVEEIESCEELMRTSKHAEMSKKKRDRIDQIIKKYESNHYKFQLIEHLIN